MKLIHTADIHLDAKTETHLSKEKAKERRGELLSTFLKLIDYAEENDVQGILISGDLFDGKNVSKMCRTTVAQAIESHPNIQFFYLRGNHDQIEMFEEGQSSPDNLKLFSTGWSSYPLSDIVSVTGAELSDDNPGLYDQLILRPDRINIIMLHGQVSETAGIGAKDNVRLKSLQNRYIDYLALGHIHKHEEEKLDNRGVYVYPGCLEGRGYDEFGVKGFVLLDIDEEEKKITPSFIPFAKRTVFDLKVDISNTDNTLGIKSLIDRTIEDSEACVADLVRVELTGEFDAEAEKDPDYLETVYKDSFYDFSLKDRSKTIVKYENYLGDISLKGEFVRIVQAEMLPPEEASEIIRTGLKALAGEV